MVPSPGVARVGQSFLLWKIFKAICAYGIDCACEYENNGFEGLPCLCWDDDDKQLIHKWVRYYVIRGLLQSMRVSPLRAECKLTIT
jgi:hypothetical protein